MTRDDRQVRPGGGSEIDDNAGEGIELSDRHGDELRNLGYVVVSPEGPKDGGDFGSRTTGTTTAGFREAIEHAKRTNRDVWVVGGARSGGGPDNDPIVYEFQETLHVPWMQDFDLRGSTSYLIQYVGDGDAVVIDSQMNCQYKFGLIWSDGDGAVLRIKPKTEGPDDFATFIASVVEWGALVNHGVVDHQDTGSGLVLDASEASINQCLFVGEETNTQELGVYLTDDAGDGGAITNNWIQVRYLNQNHASGGCTNLQVGDPGSTKIRQNRIDTSLTPPRGVYHDDERGFVSPDDFEVPDDAYGAVVHGQNNLLSISCAPVQPASSDTLETYGRAPGNDLVFGETARENLVYALNLPHGSTNEAASPTNRVISADPDGLAIQTPPIPASGETVTNRNPVPVEVTFLSTGAARGLTVEGATPSDDPMPIDNVSVGQSVTLSPGESISVEYEEAPTWRWRAIR